MRLWWIDTKWGCGGLITNTKGVVIGSAPIFRKLQGQYIDNLQKRYKVIDVAAYMKYKA